MQAVKPIVRPERPRALPKRGAAESEGARLCRPDQLQRCVFQGNMQRIGIPSWHQRRLKSFSSGILATGGFERESIGFPEALVSAAGRDDTAALRFRFTCRPINVRNLSHPPFPPTFPTHLSHPPLLPDKMAAACSAFEGAASERCEKFPRANLRPPHFRSTGREERRSMLVCVSQPSSSPHLHSSPLVRRVPPSKIRSHSPWRAIFRRRWWRASIAG